MLERFVAGATALCLSLLPLSAAARPAGVGAAPTTPAHVAQQLEATERTIALELTADMLRDRGYEVGLEDELAREAVLQNFGPRLVASSLPVTVALGDNARAIVLLPLDELNADIVEIPLTLLGPDGRHRSYWVEDSGEQLVIRGLDGLDLAEVPVVFEDGVLRLDPINMTVFAFDLPIDFSLSGIIQALQGVLDLLYTIKGLLNSIICAVQSAVDMLYGLTNCGVGTTVIGGGEIYSNVQCSVPKVKNFISALQNYCF